MTLAQAVVHPPPQAFPLPHDEAQEDEDAPARANAARHQQWSRAVRGPNRRSISESLPLPLPAVMPEVPRQAGESESLDPQPLPQVTASPTLLRPAGADAFQAYGPRDRANAGANTLPELHLISAAMKAKWRDEEASAIELAAASEGDINNNKEMYAEQNSSLSDIVIALEKAWHTTRTGFRRLWQRDGDKGDGHSDAAGRDGTDDAQTACTSPSAPRLLTFGALRSAIPGMSGLFALHGIGAVPLVLLIFRWPASQSHNACNPPADDQLPDWQIHLLQVALTGLAVAGSGAYVALTLRRHWPRLSGGGKCIAALSALALTGVSAILTYYDRTLTAGRLAAGLADKYLEILVTNGWTVEVGPAAGNARTLTAWGVILAIVLFVTHMIRSGIFVGIEALLHYRRIGTTTEIALRAAAKIVSEVASFGVMMPTLMALTNALFRTQFIVRGASRSIRQSAYNMVSRGASVMTGDDSRIDCLRDLYRALKRPLSKREFWSKFVALPSLGHNTICAGGPTDMNAGLWSLNAAGDAGLETIKAYDALSFQREAKRQKASEALRTITLVADFLQTAALPSERLNNEVSNEDVAETAAEALAQAEEYNAAL